VRWLRTNAVLVAVTALAVVARFATLDAQSFWYDEALTHDLVTGSFGHMLDGVFGHEAQPPLYFVLAWLWTRIAGTGEIGLRSFSALVGTLTIPVAYAIGARLGGRTAGLIAAALVAFNPFLIWFSQEARSYALLVLLCSLATLFWLRGRALAWGIAAALALLAHYFAVFLLIPQAVVLIARHRRAAAPGIAVVGAAAVLLAPLALAQRDARVDWVGAVPLSQRLADVAKHWVAGPFGSPVDALVAVGALLFVVGVVLVLRLPRETARPSLLLAATAVAGAALPLVLAAAGVDYVLDRYVIASLVPLLAVAAHGLASVRAGRVAAVALACLFAGFTITWMADPELHREDWREVAQRVSRSSAVVVTPQGENAMRVYLPAATYATAPVRSVVYAVPWRFGEPRPPTPAPPGPGLTLTGREELPTITLVRFEAQQPLTLAPEALAARTLDPGEPAVVLVVP
jgi:uncharacterized membrane protein